MLSKKILVVEDSCHLRELLGQILASRGWDPILAESGREALAKLECQPPRVILMDMRLPDISGFALAAILKKHPVYRNIPILAATGSAGDMPGSGVFRQVAMISFPNPLRFPCSKGVLPT